MLKLIRGKNNNSSSRLFVVIAALILSAAILFTVTHPAIVGASAVTRLIPVRSVQRDNKAVSLTFDASVNNGDCTEIIAVLEKYNVRATFFVSGEWVDKYPDSVLTIHEAGHEIMSGGDKIVRFVSLSYEQVTQSAKSSQEKIAAITGITPELIRIPYGEYDDNIIAAINDTGMLAVLWSLDSQDWRATSTSEVVRRVTSEVAPGDIIRFRTGGEFTADALTEIIEYLLSNRYSLVPVSELILKGDCTVSYDGRQRPS